MLSDAQQGDVLSGKPWIWMPPAIMITLTILSINFVGEGLKDAFNPKVEIKGCQNFGTLFIFST